MDLTIQPQPLGGILQRLVDVLGAVEGTDLFNGPAVPPTNVQGVPQLSVIAYGGAPPDGSHNEGFIVLRRSTFQIIGRHEDYDVAYAAAESAYEALSVHDVVLRGLYFVRISPRSEMTDLPLDPQRRARVAFSIETVSRLLPGARQKPAGPAEGLRVEGSKGLLESAGPARTSDPEGLPSRGSSEEVAGVLPEAQAEEHNGDAGVQLAIFEETQT